MTNIESDTTHEHVYNVKLSSWVWLDWGTEGTSAFPAVWGGGGAVALFAAGGGGTDGDFDGDGDGHDGYIHHNIAWNCEGGIMVKGGMYDSNLGEFVGGHYIYNNTALNSFNKNDIMVLESKKRSLTI